MAFDTSYDVINLSKPVLDGHLALSGHYSISRGCPLNTGFTVYSVKKFLVTLKPLQ